MNINFNGNDLEFDSIFYFSPVGNDSTGDGSLELPFKTPTGAAKKGFLNINNNRKLCFILESGVYTDTNIWFNTSNTEVIDDLKITILSHSPEQTIIKTSMLMNLNYIGAIKVDISLLNFTIDLDKINTKTNALINFEIKNLPQTNINFHNIMLRIGESSLKSNWFLVGGEYQQNELSFTNSVIDTLNNYQLNSINKVPNINRTIRFNNCIINEKLEFNTLPSVIIQEFCLTTLNIKNSYLNFPLNQDVSHKGNTKIVNPDGGLSHLGVCGGENAWHFDTYWYKFIPSDEFYDKIPLSQVKQHYRLQHYIPNGSLNEQINSIEQDIDGKGNKNFSYALSSINTYNILDFIKSPKKIYYIINEDLLGNFDSTDLHKVLLDIKIPIANNSHIFVYKNGILLKENINYEIKDNNQVLLYFLNLGDEIHLVAGWENFLNDISINYMFNEDGSESDRIDNIICKDIPFESKYSYNTNNKLISQVLINDNKTILLKNYSYSKEGRLQNIIME